MIYSRLPADSTLDQRVSYIDSLWIKLGQNGRQAERLRWRIGIELHVVQEIVLAEGLHWEAWCEEHIGRSQRDIRKLIAMARERDPEAAHEAEKAAARTGMARTRQSRLDDRSNMPAAPAKRYISDREATERAAVARYLIGAILMKFTPEVARQMLGTVSIQDLIDALDEAKSPRRALRVVSSN